MITITIEGNRGEGKTVTAGRIVAYLRSMGFSVKYEARTRFTEECVEDHFKRDGGRFVGSELREFLVRDVCEREDAPATVEPPTAPCPATLWGRPGTFFGYHVTGGGGRFARFLPDSPEGGPEILVASKHRDLKILEAEPASAGADPSFSAEAQ